MPPAETRLCKFKQYEGIPWHRQRPLRPLRSRQQHLIHVSPDMHPTDKSTREHTGIFLFSVKQFVDPGANLAVGDFHVVLSAAIVGHKGEETILGNIDLCSTLVFLYG